MANKLRVCRFEHCTHKGDKIDTLGNDFEVEDNGKAKSYFHKDCYQTKKQLVECRKIWLTDIDKGVVMSQLSSILKTLAIDNGYGSDYVLFGLKYAIGHKDRFNLRYPPGLKYILQRSEVKDAYERTKPKPKPKKAVDKVIKKEGVSFNFTPSNRKKTFSELFGEGAK